VEGKLLSNPSNDEMTLGHWRFVSAFGIALAICSPIVAGATAIGAGWQFNDAKLRRSLQNDGIRVPATAYSDKSEYWRIHGGCGKGVRVRVSYKIGRGEMHSECVRDTLGAPSSFYYLSPAYPPLESIVHIAYARDNPPSFAFTNQFGSVPQRDVNHVWRDWALQNLAIFPLTVLFSAFQAWVFTRRRRCFSEKRT